MSRQLSKRAKLATALVGVTLLVNGCEAQVWGTPPAPENPPQATDVVPQAPPAPLPQVPPGAQAAPFDGLDARTRQATADAADAGATVEVVVLDRNTGQTVSNGNNRQFPIASVVKLFIADDLLLQVSKGETTLSPADRASLDVMLRSSDDSAAQMFWDRSGGNASSRASRRATGWVARRRPTTGTGTSRSEEHTSELQSQT